MDDGMNLQLNNHDFATLLLCLGYAMGSADKATDCDLAERFMNLANRINEGNPNFVDVGMNCVQLNNRDFATLLLCLGYAMGSAVGRMNYDLAERFMNLANRINEGNPNFTPYRWDPVTKTVWRLEAT